MECDPTTASWYDAWKARCAREKKEREEARSKQEYTVSPESRKRKTPFGDDDRDLTSATTRGTYVLLPTVPPIRVLMDADKKTILGTHERPIASAQIVKRTQSDPITPSPSPLSSPHSSFLLPPVSESPRLSSVHSSLRAFNDVAPRVSYDNLLADFQEIPSSILLRNCAVNHDRLRYGLPLVGLTQYIPNSTNANFPLSSQGFHSDE